MAGTTVSKFVTTGGVGVVGVVEGEEELDPPHEAKTAKVKTLAYLNKLDI